MLNNTATMFGLDSDRFIKMIDQLALSQAKTCYSFMDKNDYDQLLVDNPTEGMQVYWNELLSRAHLTAIVAILRSRHWIRSIISAKKDQNLLSFAAAYRGFIESSADACSALVNIPSTLAREHLNINCALRGELENTFFISSEMEEVLIHFSHARHLTKDERATMPTSHEAKKVREYIDILEKAKLPQVITLYKSLCDLTHPGANSVWMWLSSEDGVDIKLSTNWTSQNFIDVF